MGVPAVLVAVLAMVTVGAAAPGDFPDTSTCIITGAGPSKPLSLSFCHKFNDDSCCAPAADSEANEMFDSLMNLGLSCRIRGDVRAHPMAKFYCLGCDPNQPKYVRNEPYVPFCEGTCPSPPALYQYYPSSVFTAPSSTPDNTNPTISEADSFKSAPLVTPTDSTLSPTLARRQMILICKDWADKEFGTPTDSFLSVFSRCGIIKSAPCLDADGKQIPDRDRYVCGDDIIMPAQTYSSVEAFLNAEQLGPPNFSDQFGFVLVSNRPCQASDFLPAITPVQGGNRQNGEFDRFHPDCLRTVDEIKANGVSMWSAAFDGTNNDASANYLNPTTDELCFNSAASVVPYATLLLLSLIAALLTL